MKQIFNAQAWHLSNRELEGMMDEIRRDIGACEQRSRRDAASLAHIRTVQAQRRKLRPNH